MKTNKYRPDCFYLFAVFLTILWGLFYCRYAGEFDLRSHTIIAQYVLSGFEESMPFPHVLAYPLYHITEKAIHYLLKITYEDASVIIICSCNMISAALYRKLLTESLKLKESTYLIDFISLGAVVFMPACSWFTNNTFYSIHTGANPLHNPTVLFVRPFGLLSVIFFLRVVDEYESENISTKSLIGFSIFSLLSVFAKPSFAIVFFPAMGCMCLLIAGHKKDFRFLVKLFLGILPSVFALLWQFIYTRNNSEAIDTVVLWGGFTGYHTFDIFKVTIGMVPAAIILIHRSENKAYILSWVAFCIGWIQMFTLSNGWTGDYSWGFMLAMQFVTAVSLAVSEETKHGIFSKGQRKLGLLVFGYQVFSGLRYFYMVYEMGDYWI